MRCSSVCAALSLAGRARTRFFDPRVDARGSRRSSTRTSRLCWRPILPRRACWPRTRSRAASDRPREIWTGGERLSGAQRSQLTEVFGCEIRDGYGASEFLSIAWDCGCGGLHVNADWIVLEPVDEAGHPVPPASRPTPCCSRI